MTDIVFKWRNRSPMNVKEIIVHADDDGIRFEFVESEVHSTTTPKIYFNDPPLVHKEGKKE